MGKPNVLILYPDQMRFDAMGCSGNPLVKTPHIDRLASQGVRFDHAYASFPLCCPFRASVMTGKFAHAHGMYANHYPISLEQTFLAEVFRDHGYRTGYIGKWHLDGGIKHGYIPPDRRLGFDWFVGFNRGHEYFNSIFYRQDDPTPRVSKRYEPDVQTDHLLEFLDETDERPFLAMVSWGPPHPPLVMPEEYETMYAEDEVPVRENSPDEAGSRAFLARYYGMVTAIDDNVGRIMNYLDEKGLCDNTIVYFVSDHGEMAGEHGLYDKRVYYEASMRVPLIVRWPEKLAGDRVADGLVYPGVDLMPTLLELCEIPIPDSVQGTSFAPVLRDETTSGHDVIHYKWLMESDGPEKVLTARRGMRTHDWLYAATQSGPEVLFNLRNDPLEMDNLVNRASHRDIVEELDGTMKTHMDETNDDWGTTAIFPPPNFQTHDEGPAYFQELIEKAIIEE